MTTVLINYITEAAPGFANTFKFREPSAMEFGTLAMQQHAIHLRVHSFLVHLAEIPSPILTWSVHLLVGRHQQDETDTVKIHHLEVSLWDEPPGEGVVGPRKTARIIRITPGDEHLVAEQIIAQLTEECPE
ncbi:MAG: hypothetical protein RJB39_153 [Candidatus Parcubacteria bacterium]|jgi:hypothetical protein